MRKSLFAKVLFQDCGFYYKKKVTEAVNSVFKFKWWVES